jgi:hypothetical protein
MKKFWQYHLYFIGLTVLSLATLYLNWDMPPNFDEAHAYNIARYLSPLDIFTISKTEGHPFLWYYLLMPFAKLHLFYPHPLYVLNWAIMLVAFILFYKNAPLPVYIKYFITFSAPFLQMYIAFARSYCLVFLFLFALLSLYPQRNKRPVLYLTFIILLANTHPMGLLLAFSIGIIFFIETALISWKQRQITMSFLWTVVIGLLEVILFLLQFYGYDKNTPVFTPKFITLRETFVLATSPLNLWFTTFLLVLSLGIFTKYKRWAALSFLSLTTTTLLLFFIFIYSPNTQHIYFFYIALICAYWLAYFENKTPFYIFLPLSILSFGLIFNGNINLKREDDVNYYVTLRESALKINDIFPTEQDIIFIDNFQENILVPYFNPNIHPYDQKLNSFGSVDSFKDFLSFIYEPLKAEYFVLLVKKSPQALLFRTCGEDHFENSVLNFNLQYKLNEVFCLYDIKLH